MLASCSRSPSLQGQSLWTGSLPQLGLGPQLHPAVRCPEVHWPLPLTQSWEPGGREAWPRRRLRLWGQRLDAWAENKLEAFVASCPICEME